MLVACGALSLLSLTSVAQARAETTTITIDGDGVTPKRVSVSFETAVRWANEDPEPTGSPRPRASFKSAGSAQVT